MVKVARDTNAATLFLQERVEQLRLLRWPDLTSSTYIAETYLRNRPRSRAALDKVSETIRIAPYPAATQGGQPLSVVQSTAGTATVDSTQSGFALTNERLVWVELTLKWLGADGRSRERTTATLISNSGITRNTLPAMGQFSEDSGNGNGNGNGTGIGSGNGNTGGKNGKG
jgi:hypothetical protein